MNCPTRVDPEALPNGWNQNPDAFAGEGNGDVGAVANRVRRHDRCIELVGERDLDERCDGGGEEVEEGGVGGGGCEKMRGVIGDEEKSEVRGGDNDGTGVGEEKSEVRVCDDGAGVGEEKREVVGGDNDAGSGAANGRGEGNGGGHQSPGSAQSRLSPGGTAKAWRVMKTYAKFVGPGWMISVAYIDPGNYATDIAAGASNRFRLLVVVFVSNVIAIFLQSLCVKLGSVTGLNLAEMCKKHCPPWLNLVLFFFAEAAIIVTDMAEVIGTAIALNLLLNIPLVAGCAISIADVLIILLLYRPGGAMRGVRIFEALVAALVLGVVVCFSIELSMISVPDVGNLFRGFLPSSALIERNGLLQACGILGATVMPHSLYLGSGLVQSRLYDYDEEHKHLTHPASAPAPNDNDSEEKYQPSLAAIRFCLKYSIADLTISLLTFALFVNSAILIVAGASLSDSAGATDASLFSIFDLLKQTIGKPAAIVFALALLLSGVSAGIICTIAGQMVWLGQLEMPIKPWQQRLCTRSIAITPSIIIAGAVGKEGISRALEASQIALSVLLPVVAAPLIWFTCRSVYMTVPVMEGGTSRTVNMRNNWLTAGVAIAMWLLIVVMNVASWVLQAL